MSLLALLCFWLADIQSVDQVFHLEGRNSAISLNSSLYPNEPERLNNLIAAKSTGFYSITKDIWASKPIFRCTFALITARVFLAVSGIDIISSYSVRIMKNSGIELSTIHWIQFTIPIYTILSLLAIKFLLQKLKRKPVLMIGMFLTSITFSCMGIFFKESNPLGLKYAGITFVYRVESQFKRNLKIV